MTTLPSHPEPPPPLPLGAGLRSTLPLPLGEGRGEGAQLKHHHATRAFTLTELLVVVSIILVLMAMIGSAVSAARGSQKRQATQALIARLDAIISHHYSSYASRAVPGATTSALRAAGIRRMISADLPDSWSDVDQIAGGADVLPSVLSAGKFPKTASQHSYAAIWNALSASQKSVIGQQFGDAECLFMIVMQGGIADCLDCGALRTTEVGDTDKDGMPEFLDAWGNPIRYVLWPAALEIPPGNDRFFSTTPPFSSGTPAAAKGGTMRPLIFSGGPDGINATRVNGSGNLAAGAQCGDPAAIDFGAADGPGTADNITNFDAEVAK